MDIRDHTLRALDEVAQLAPTASRERLSALRSFLLSAMGAHRTEISALGIDDRWTAEFERAHRAATAAVDEARAVLREAAATRMAALAPDRHLQIPESRADARRLVREALDHEGAEPAPMRVVRGPGTGGTATFRWQDPDQDRLLIHGAGREDRVVHLDDVIGVSTCGGLTLVLREGCADDVIRLDRMAEAA